MLTKQSSYACSSVPNGSTSTNVAQTVITTLTEKIDILDDDSVRHMEPKIIKVPADITKDHEDAYRPRLLFIGPYHRRTSPMEEVKLLYLKDLLLRDRNHNNLSHYVEEILKHEKRARKEYSDPIKLSNEEFVEMLVLDGCFIIEFLLKRAEGKNDPPISSQVRTSPTLRRDLLLLENQIPFFILQTILTNSKYKLPQTFLQGTTLVDVALHYLSKGKIEKDKLSEVHRNEEKIYHLLHLSYLCLMVGLSPPRSTTDTSLTRHDQKLHGNVKLYMSRLVSFIRYHVHLFIIYFIYSVVHVLVLLFLWRKPSWSVSIEKSSKKPRMLPTATELKEAGVTFKKKKKNPDCYLDVSFDKEGYFEIPLLSIQENTNSVFRNFLAFEQSCPNVGNSFTSYVVLMDNLIDTSSDVAVLKRRGVLESKLGCDDDVAKLFNQMRSGLCFDFDKHYLDEMFRDVKDYCNKEHNRWRAKLMHDYLGNPWAIISIVAAVALLVLTTLQAIYSVLRYKRG